MLTLAALALSTPVWGFALQPPMAISSIAPTQIADVRALPYEEPFGRRTVPEPEADDDPRFAETRTMMDLIRGFQVATNVGLATTFTLGVIAFSDRYGLNSDVSQTACAQGTTVLGYCEGDTPVANIVSASVTGAFALTSFVLWTQTDTELAMRLDRDWSTYALTRIIARGMNIVGAIWGLLLWSATDIGWANEQQDFDTLQALWIAHTGWQSATLALETVNTALVF